MGQQLKIPTFRNDRESAEFWATHDSATYRRELQEVAVKVSQDLRRRIAARAKIKKSGAPGR